MILPVDYKQTDPRWKSIDYSAKGEKTTIGGSGCGPTAVADILAAWIDPSITPKTECAWSLKNGYKAPHQGTYYQYVDAALNRYGIKTKRLTSGSIYNQPNHPAIKEALNVLEKGDCVLVACMGKGTWTSSGHFVTPYKLDRSRGIIYIRDPASSKIHRTEGNLTTWKSQVKQLWIVYYPFTKEKKGEEDMTKKETQALIEDALNKQQKEILTELKKLAPTYYENIQDLPYGQDIIQNYVNLGILKGTGKGLHLSEDLLRTLIIINRIKENEE